MSQMKESAPLLEIDGLSVVLDSDEGWVRAVDALSLTIRTRQTFALVGESGSGKSMSALAMLRLLPEAGQIVAGSTRLSGQDLNALPERQMRKIRGRRISMIFQEPASCLNPVMRVGDQILENVLAHTALRGQQARERVVYWLDRVGIPDAARRIDDYPFQLSGGQKQRVMIAMALAAEPDLLIADEPTTALDVTIQAQILQLLKSLQQELGMAMLLITHDLGVVKQMAQHVALMYAGQIVEVAPAAQFFKTPQHPYAQLLFNALPGRGRRGQPLRAIAGTVPALTQRFSSCRFADRCPKKQPVCEQTAPEMDVLHDEHSVRCFFPGALDLNTGSTPRPNKITLTEAQLNPDVLLSVENLSVHFPIKKGLLRRTVGWVKAVDLVNFSIGKGRTLALVGESGCGKTTTGKALIRLLDGQANIGGQAHLLGENLLGAKGAALQRLRQSIQIVFQDPFSSLNPRMRIGDILEEGVEALAPHLDAAARKQRVRNLLDQVGLRAAVLDRYPHEFSGGQRQRIAIARALAVEPKLLICDEPTSALDVSVQAQILNLLKNLQKELGIAYLFITHNFGVVEYLADDIVVMRSGHVVESGLADDVLHYPVQSYTRQLLAAVPPNP
ncbi:MAG: dipeptide ABC transporter ATP-binding protein [Pigmentiphaga sp.]